MAKLEDIPTPSPIPSPSNSPYTLSERINIATRPVHSQLNRLILARLPLALPPHTNNPSTYVSGILHIAPIYVTFETLWNSILNAPPLPTSLAKTLDVCDPSFQIVDDKSIPIIPGEGIPELRHTPKVCSRTNALLSHLRLPGLLRAGRLRADIRVLSGTPEHQIDAQLEAVSKNGRLAEFISHTTRAVEANPHVLLSYAWVLYMALFAGGRYLRASLSEAGGSFEFWDREPSPVRPYSVTQPPTSPLLRRASKSDSTMPAVPTHRPSRPKTRSESSITNTTRTQGLQFFHFVGDEDGEDIKREFKKRITEAEVLLTDGEKEDIVTEAQNIFIFMVEMISELDDIMGTSDEDLKPPSHTPLSKTRDSVSVTKERLQKTVILEGRNLEMKRKPTHLEVLFSGPIARVVRFNEVVIDPMARKLSDILPFTPKVSVDEARDEGLDVLLKSALTILPVFALLLGLLVWWLSR